MSIKIYDGYKATSSDVFGIAQAIRDAVEPIFHQRFASAFATATEGIGKNWDDVFPALLPRPYVTAWQTPVPKSAWDRADKLYELIEVLHGTAVHTFSDLDFGYNIVLLPNRAPNESEPLVLVYGEHSDAYRLAIEGAGLVIDYGYWDNTNRPDGVSNAAWRRRKAAWGSILDEEDKTPSEAGLLIEQPIKMTTTWRVTRPLIEKGEA